MMKIDDVKELIRLICRKDANGLRELLMLSPELANAEAMFGLILHDAAGKNNVEALKLLLEYGANINARSGPYNGNALNYAAAQGAVEAVKFLLEHDSEIDIGAPERNPLFSAANCGHLDVVKLLVATGMNAKLQYTGRYMKDMDAAALAREQGHSDVALYLEGLPAY
jgi:ankyrin repeat protein